MFHEAHERLDAVVDVQVGRCVEDRRRLIGQVPAETRRIVERAVDAVHARDAVRDSALGRFRGALGHEFLDGQRGDVRRLSGDHPDVGLDGRLHAGRVHVRRRSEEKFADGPAPARGLDDVDAHQEGVEHLRRHREVVDGVAAPQGVDALPNIAEIGLAEFVAILVDGEVRVRTEVARDHAVAVVLETAGEVGGDESRSSCHCDHLRKFPSTRLYAFFFDTICI